MCLHRLCACAPEEDSDVAFVPQQRAVNIMKGCQRWITSDDDEDGEDEELEPIMTLLFIHLAPILQSVPGSHWDFIFDVIESNLDPDVRFHSEAYLNSLLTFCFRLQI
jgi:E3 ubiquitin-protein ligase listerin